MTGHGCTQEWRPRTWSHYVDMDFGSDVLEPVCGRLTRFQAFEKGEAIHSSLPVPKSSESSEALVQSEEKAAEAMCAERQPKYGLCAVCKHEGSVSCGEILRYDGVIYGQSDESIFNLG